MGKVNTQRYFWGKTLLEFKYSINGIHKEKYCPEQFVLITPEKEATTEIHSMSLNRLAAIVFMASFASVCSAQTIFCPEQIKTPSPSFEDYPGWKTFTSSQPQYFEQISITSGSPDQEATLVPDIDTKKQVGWTISEGEEFWVVCHYLSSNIRLAQRLPSGIRQCTVKLKSVGTKSVQQTNELTCK